MTKRFIAHIIASVFLISAIASGIQLEEVSAAENRTIVAGETKEVNITEDAKQYEFTFLPTETAIYRFSSDDIAFGSISDSTGQLVVSDNMRWDFGYYVPYTSFDIECKMIEGNTYWLATNLPIYRTGTYNVTLTKLGVAESVAIEKEETMDCLYGFNKTLDVSFAPENTSDVIVSFCSDNEDVVTVDKDGTIFGNAFGAANVTVTTETGLTDTIRVNVVDHPDIISGETKKHDSWDKNMCYKFTTPDSATYKVALAGALYQNLKIYDEGFNLIAESDEYILELEEGDIIYLYIPTDTGDHITALELSIVNTTHIDNSALPDDIKPSSIYPYGDLTRDNKVNAEDALKALKVASHIEEIDEDHVLSGDVNKDGKVDAKDALQMLKVSAKLDVFTVTANIKLGESYVLNNIRDKGAYRWEYEVVSQEGIEVVREYLELKNAAPGLMNEQVYTMTPTEVGTYELILNLESVGTDDDTIETIRCIINVTE